MTGLAAGGAKPERETFAISEEGGGILTSR
jgi:hypothetical protein